MAGPVPSNDRVLPAPLGVGWGLGLVGGQQRRPQEIANLVEWVIGDVDEWMTGQTLVSDGGHSRT